MGRTQFCAALLALALGLSLAACGRAASQAPGSGLESGVAAIEDAMNQVNQSGSSALEPVDDLRRGSSADTVATPGDFPAAYYYGSAEEVARDAEGLQTMRTLGRNMAFMMKSFQLGKEQFGLPPKEAPVFMNFHR